MSLTFIVLESNMAERGMLKGQKVKCQRDIWINASEGQIKRQRIFALDREMEDRLQMQYVVMSLTSNVIQFNMTFKLNQS